MDSAQTAARGDAGTPFTSVPIEITVSVGRARPLVRELLQLNEGSVLALDKQLDDPVELYVGEKLIAIGVLEVVDGEGPGQLAVRITEVVDLQSPA
ncbi:FliM/FliN family flagellar motor switch protein [Mameliella sediminis]|uniref:FliM/FliN family flagellar motor switch protein n=1 Tax=Mameliella sediminis TaxID=2836866 RepID=UPI001C462332|nr:FliM/FliN family flagellar motor switch protein [Mameliella sediminis]MBY6114133.1 FliM/FliN family flagellar motor switch protein [Antarctobacter heliothermus]MBY6142519.1 FliM/FliN family flagellar motor switch protein [Mameliella alba]MBV7395430.1 FliM/FliN family flagellar motor switch protein [Mameliella sediminis]MBY6159347.1 FliM/FliN family flagellar motor switch protein [Mameliella alba]MBY6167818.1 FliM/FliN family flagellar motor switch protein [Mameliella alba]